MEIVAPPEVGLHRVEWTGLPSPYADPEIRLRLALRQLGPAKRHELRELEGRRQSRGYCRFAGVTTRILGREVDVFPDGTFREQHPSAPPAHPGDRTLAFGWTEDNRRYGRLEDLAPHQLVTHKAHAYVAEPGWDRAYVFGPWEFVQPMTVGDLVRLMGHAINRRCFRDLEAPLVLVVGAGGRVVAR